MPSDNIPFQALSNSDYVCSTWFERDRMNVRLETKDGQVIFDLWDEAVEEAIVDGYLKPPRRPRPTDDDWLYPALDYARLMELIK